MRLRALIEAMQRGSPRDFGLFEQGILGVMAGGLEYMEEDNVPPYQALPNQRRLMERHGVGHTVGNLIAWLGSYPSPAPLDKKRAVQLQVMLQEQTKALHDAWQDVVTGYAHEQLVHAGKAKASDKPKREGRRTY
jgi:hypothetical protein